MALIFTPPVMYSILREPIIQTFIVRTASAYISEELNTEIRIGSLYINPFLDIIIKDILVKDKKDNAILKTGKLQINIKRFSIKNKEIKLNKFSMNNADINMIKYKGDTAMNFQFIIYAFTDTLSGPSDSENWNISIENLKLADCYYKLLNENQPPKDEGMDFNDLYITGIDLYMHDLKISKTSDTILFNINQLNATEKSGFEIKKLRGKFAVSSGNTTAEHFKLITNNSAFAMNLEFLYDDFQAFNDFLNKVKLNTVIGNSSFNLYDIGYFAPVLFQMDNPMVISGTFTGHVSALKARNFKFAFAKNTELYGNFYLNGLPNVKETFANLDIKKLITNKKDIENFAIPGENKINLAENFESMGRIYLSGLFTGFYNDFIAKADILTEIGKLSSDISLKNLKTANAITYKGFIDARNFNLGKFSNTEPMLGSLNLKAKINGTGLTAETARVFLNGIADSIKFQDKLFRLVEISGELANRKFSGNLIIDDKELNLNFDGTVDFEKEPPVFDFYASIDSADLYNLNLFSRDTLMILSSVLNVNFTGIDIDRISGTIKIDSTYYMEGNRSYLLDHFSIDISKDSNDIKKIVLLSDYVDADINGNFNFSDIGSSFKLLTDNYIKAFELDETIEKDTIPGQSFHFDINLKNTHNITELFFPQLELASNSKLSGFYYPHLDSIIISGNSDSLNYQGIKFMDWKLQSKIKNNTVDFQTSSAKVLFKEATAKDTISLGIENAAIGASIGRDSIKYVMKWNDNLPEDFNRGNVQGYVRFVDYPRIETKITSAKINVNDTSWKINKNNLLVFDTTSFAVQDFSVFSSGQSFEVNGKISEQKEDSLKLAFRNWKISNFDPIYASNNIDLDGELNGFLNFVNIYYDPHFNTDIRIDDFYFNKTKFGDAHIKTSWDNTTESLFASAEIIHKGNVENVKTLDAEGYYYTSYPKDSLDFEMKLHNYNISSLEPFVQGIFSNTEGVATGRVTLSGYASAPDLLGKLLIMRGGIKVDYLNTDYTFSHEIDFQENFIAFHDMLIRDSLGNTATINGGIKHNHLADLALDLEIAPQNLLCLNTNQRQNSIFYGDAFATGNINFSGPFNDLKLDARARTDKGTQVYIPISLETDVFEKDYIVFVNTIDTITDKKDETYNVNMQGLDLNFELNITPEAEIQLFLPMQMGNIRARGEGNMKIGIAPQGDFGINGDYVIDEGTFLFTLRKIVNRRFDILKGGKISWTGNPYDAEIDVRALYQVKTSLYGLGAEVDTTANFSKRVNVNCIIELKNQLFDPDIKFSIQLPNVDEQTRQVVYSVLDTTDESQMNQQMISLLVLGSFSYRTIDFNASSASAKLISNQLSNWLSQISQDFDIGVNYRPGDQISQEEIEVALSTQLFNDRVIIDGNFGVVGDKTSSNASNIVGDVNVEVKITEDGRLRVRAFNRSNYNSVYDVNTFDDIAPYTQGIGIFYRKEFDNFGELFNRKQKKKIKTKQVIE